MVWLELAVDDAPRESAAGQLNVKPVLFASTINVKVSWSDGWTKHNFPTWAKLLACERLEILACHILRCARFNSCTTPRRLFHIITFNNNGHFRTLAMGGVDDDNNVLNTVEEWEPEIESWSTVETRLKEKRESFGAVAVNKNLVCPEQ